jgi:hypothetical protein
MDVPGEAVVHASISPKNKATSKLKLERRNLTSMKARKVSFT